MNNNLLSKTAWKRLEKNSLNFKKYIYLNIDRTPHQIY